MARQERTLELPIPAAALHKSLSDRPLPLRMLVHSGRFVVRKPLGGFGVLVIALVICAALSADLISRYHPETSFAVEKPACTPAQAAQVQVSPTGQVTNRPPIDICFDEVLPGVPRKNPSSA